MIVVKQLQSDGSAFRRLALLTLIPAFLAAILTWMAATNLLPADQWWRALVRTNDVIPNELLFRHAFVPRVAVSVFSGLGLGLAGALLQHLLRNPLAEPTTIGTNAGAGLALTVATLYVPSLLESGREWVALAGGTASTLLVFMLARQRHFSPVAIIVSGLVVSLTCGSAGFLLMAINREYTEDLFIWQSGSLVQNGDAVARALFAQLATVSALAFAFVRPMRLLEAGDESAKSLGASPIVIRLFGLSIAVALSTFVVAAVGAISFLALAAPAFATIAGARTLLQRMIWSPLIAASQLWLVDQLVQLHPQAAAFPAGAATALLGAPLLFLFLLRLRAAPMQSGEPRTASKMRRGPRSLAALAAGLAFTVLVAFFFGRSLGGWDWLATTQMNELVVLRLPRIVVALSAGIMLGICGTLLQRMTGNAMAAPEVLGVSGGACLGVLILFLISPTLARISLLISASIGAVGALALVYVTAGRHLSSERLLLAGTATTTLASALAAVVLASGDPRLTFLLAWLSGSTYTATATDAWIAAVTAVVLGLLAPLTARWLSVLPLGETVSTSLGLRLRLVRSALLLLIAVPTAVAVLVIGPLSFVGLMAPHLAALTGFRRPVLQIFAAAIYGALMLTIADWAGRTIIFPWQVPAGLLTALVGGPFFLFMMARAPRSSERV